MRLIESYLNEVGRYLPAAQRRDILSELRVSLEEQVLEVAGGSAPDAEHEKQAINALGHPLRVASGFQRQRYLIGPELFPSFVLTLKTVMIIIVLIQLALMLTSYVTSGWTTSPFGLAHGLAETVIWAVLVVIGVFAAIEYSGDRLNWYSNWTADSLKPVAGSPVEQGSLITNLITEGVFLLWWNGVLELQNWIPGAQEIFTIRLSDVWSVLYWPLNLVAGGWFVLHGFVLYRGLWQRTTVVAETLFSAAFIATGIWLLFQSPLVIVDGSIGEMAGATANRVVISILLVIMAIAAWDSFVALRRLRRQGSP